MNQYEHDTGHSGHEPAPQALDEYVGLRPSLMLTMLDMAEKYATRAASDSHGDRTDSSIA
ncbi:MAG: hypothetical protein KY410_09195 [Proteobacteria bacterium]|nr:hypothetical protein [Pseudomonadota bacterium]